MKQQEVLKKIGGIISELSEQYQYLQSEEQHLNSLELELFVANAHFLTDHAEILRKICSSLPVSKEPPAPPVENTPTAAPAAPEAIPTPLAEAVSAAIPVPEVPEEPATVEPIVEQQPVPVIQHEPEPEIAPMISPVAEPRPEPAPEPVVQAPEEISPVPAIDLGGERDTYSFTRQAPEPELTGDSTFNISTHVDEEPVAPVQPVAVKKEEPVAVQHPVVNTTAAKTETPPPVQTLNQRLSAQLNGGTATTATHAVPKTVSDLKSAISLNDKLLFVRDLFNGYNLAYSEAVELLNRCKSFDEADRLLKANYVTKNNWQGKQATADKFYDVLHRRFAQ